MLRLLSPKAQGCKDFSKTILTLSCWYSLDSSRWVLSNDYPCARVSVIFQVFLHHFVLAKLATSSIRLNYYRIPQCLRNVCCNNVRTEIDHAVYSSRISPASHRAPTNPRPSWPAYVLYIEVSWWATHRDKFSDVRCVIFFWTRVMHWMSESSLHHQ